MLIRSLEIDFCQRLLRSDFIQHSPRGPAIEPYIERVGTLLQGLALKVFWDELFDLTGPPVIGPLLTQHLDDVRYRCFVDDRASRFIV